MKRILIFIFSPIEAWSTRQRAIELLYHAEHWLRKTQYLRDMRIDWVLETKAQELAHLDAVHLLDSACRAVKYNHGIVLSGSLSKYRRAR